MALQLTLKDKLNIYLNKLLNLFNINSDQYDEQFKMNLQSLYSLDNNIFDVITEININSYINIDQIKLSEKLKLNFIYQILQSLIFIKVKKKVENPKTTSEPDDIKEILDITDYYRMTFVMNNDITVKQLSKYELNDKNKQISAMKKKYNYSKIPVNYTVGDLGNPVDFSVLVDYLEPLYRKIDHIFLNLIKIYKYITHKSSVNEDKYKIILSMIKTIYHYLRLSADSFKEYYDNYKIDFKNFDMYFKNIYILLKIFQNFYIDCDILYKYSLINIYNKQINQKVLKNKFVTELNELQIIFTETDILKILQAKSNILERTLTFQDIEITSTGFKDRMTKTTIEDLEINNDDDAYSIRSSLSDVSDVRSYR